MGRLLVHTHDSGRVVNSMGLAFGIAVTRLLQLFWCFEVLKGLRGTSRLVLVDGERLVHGCGLTCALPQLI